MATQTELSTREQHVLEAVIRTVVDTAMPAGSRGLVREFDLGVSPATIRNTMSDLTHKGFLSQPHPNAGRVPTDKAYRYFVDTLMRIEALSDREVARLSESLGTPLVMREHLLTRAVRVLSILTREMGVGLAPQFEEGVLDRIELVAVSSERVLLVLALHSGPVRTIFVEGASPIRREALSAVADFLNERLAGLRLREVRETYRDRLADSPAEHADLINIFLEQADTVFSTEPSGDDVVLGPTTALAEQPEFADRDSLRGLLDLTEQRGVLADALHNRSAEGIVISIGGEHDVAPLTDFSLVTTDYDTEGVRGTIGVIGPTRMPYERVVAMVEYTARLLTDLAGRA